MKNEIYKNSKGFKAKLCLFILVFLFHSNFSFCVNYYTINHGNWTEAANWAGGVVPGSIINAGDTVIVIHNMIYNNGSDLEIRGALRITGVSFSTPKTGTGSGRSIFIHNTGSLYIFSGSFILPLFNGGSPLSGSLTNNGGKVNAYYSNIEIAQNWTPLNGARSTYYGGCLTLGENYTIDGSSKDSLINTCITIGHHGSGNFDIKSNSSLVISSSKILLRGTSGNFFSDGGCSVSTIGAGQFTVLDVPGNLTNNGNWAVPVNQFCVGGLVNGNIAGLTQLVSNLPPAENCAYVDTVQCRNCNLIILPVKLLSFNCVKQTESVLVKWQVNSETEQEKYEIQKSNDGVVFTTIATLLAFNLPTANYSFTDAGVIYPTTYYRLHIVGKNGNGEYSEIRKVNGSTRVEKELMVFPTVFSNTLTIELNSSTNQWCQIHLYNSQGALVYTQKNIFEEGNYTIILKQLSKLPAGIYVLNVLLDKQPQLNSRKLIKK
jgi:Secretion system C-terminal sorting domain